MQSKEVKENVKATEVKEAAKATTKAAETKVKETAKETAKTTAKVAVKTTAKAATTAAGTAVAPGVGTVAGIAAGYDATIYLSDRSDEIEQKLTSTLKSVPNEAKAEGEELSAREKEILVCVAKGMQNKEIADHFCISIYTVITHRKNITRKTGIKTVAGLTVYALLNNLIDMNSME